MRRFFAKAERGYFHKKRHPLARLDEQRAFALIFSIMRPEKAAGVYSPRDRRGHAFWYDQRNGKVRQIVNGRWDGPWKLAPIDGVEPIH